MAGWVEELTNPPVKRRIPNEERLAGMNADSLLGNPPSERKFLTRFPRVVRGGSLNQLPWPFWYPASYAF
jgi:hypothetical protein